MSMKSNTCKTCMMTPVMNLLRVHALVRVRWTSQPKKKGTRNVYSNFQLDELENAFDVTQYPDCHAIYLVSKNLNIPEKNIRVLYHKLSPIILSLCHT